MMRTLSLNVSMHWSKNMLKCGLILLSVLTLWACSSNEPDYQSIVKAFKQHHKEKDLDGILELFNGETMYEPYRKALRKALAEEVHYPIKSIILRQLAYAIPHGIYNIQPTRELIVEYYGTDYQLSSVYLFGNVDGRPTLAWILPPEPENNIAPLARNSQSLENSNSL